LAWRPLHWRRAFSRRHPPRRNCGYLRGPSCRAQDAPLCCTTGGGCARRLRLTAGKAQAGNGRVTGPFSKLFPFWTFGHFFLFLGTIPAFLGSGIHPRDATLSAPSMSTHLRFASEGTLGKWCDSSVAVNTSLPSAKGDRRASIARRLTLPWGSVRDHPSGPGLFPLGL